MAGKLDRKVILVTGGASGIGRAAAIAMADEGASVVVADRDEAGAEVTAQAISSADQNAVFIRSDVTRRADVKAMIQYTIDTYGRLDCAFNNAGIEGNVGVPIAEYDEDNWDQVIDINLKGVWLCMKYELSEMLAQGRGAIVNTASVAGLVGGTFGAAYYASKHGVVGLTRAAAVEYGKSDIRVNAVCPGVIHTEMAKRLLKDDQKRQDMIAAQHPLGRLGHPDEVAEAVVWLCSDAASFVTGQALGVDGGFVAQ